MTNFYKRCLEYTQQVKRLESWELSYEMDVQVKIRKSALKKYEKTQLPECKEDLQYANEFIFIIAGEIKRRQIP